MIAPVFVDTFSLLAMLSATDAKHAEAMRWFNHSQVPLVTTEWVLTELADGLSGRGGTTIAPRPPGDHRRKFG